jgi:hypothetical protein
MKYNNDFSLSNEIYSNKLKSTFASKSSSMISRSLSTFPYEPANEDASFVAQNQFSNMIYRANYTFSIIFLHIIKLKFLRKYLETS